MHKKKTLRQLIPWMLLGIAVGIAIFLCIYLFIGNILSTSSEATPGTDNQNYTSPVTPAETPPGGVTASPDGNEPGTTAQTGGSDDFFVKFFEEAGNGDAILICNDECMMIDAGHNGDGTKLLPQLDGITLKYLVGTHPHEDHIGGLDDIILNVPVTEVMLPEKTSTTKTYISVLEAIQEKGLQINVPEVGEVYQLGNDSFTILGPVSEAKDANNNSIVILYHHTDKTGNTTRFLFSGDAEGEEESEIVDTGLLEDVDVYKVGHHGSRTSTSEEWLSIIKPELSVIMCGSGNSYGHPHDVTVDKLESAGSIVLRTDVDGTVTVTAGNGELYYETSR